MKFFTTYSVILFVIGLMTYASFNLVGQIRIGEIIALGFFLLNLKKIFANKELRRLTALFFFSALLVGLSTYANGSGLEKVGKGVSNMLFINSSLVAFYILLKNQPQRYLIYFLGLIVGMLFFSPYNDLPVDISFEDEQYFDLVWGIWVIPILVLVGSKYFRLPYFLIFFTLFVGVLFFVNNARSTGLILLLTAVFYLLFVLEIRLKLFKLAFFSIATVVICYNLYIFLSQQEILGRLSKEQVEARSETKSSLSLFSTIGRPEFAIGVLAIIDKPIIGYGSHNENNKYAQLANYLNIVDDYYLDEEPNLTAHSVLLDTIIQGGIFASLVWFFVVRLCIQSYLKIILLPPLQFTFPIILLTVSFFWNFLFSPLGYARFSLPIHFALMLCIMQRDFVNRLNLKQT